MSNTIDIVKSAQNREYTNFEAQVKDALREKIGQNVQMKSYFDRLNVIQEAGEEKDSALQKEYDAYFEKTLKKYKADSPDKLSEEDKKKFFDEIDAGWENGVGKK